MKEQNLKPVLGYWDIRGRAQVLRLLFSCVGQEFENKTYKTPEEWFSGDRHKLGFDFPNLPYLMDGDYRLTETNAISKYIINSSGQTQLLGKSVKDTATVEQIVGVLDDMSLVTMNLAFNPNFETEKNKVFEEKLQWKISQLVKFLGEKEWVMGYLTLADFKLAEASYYLEGIWPEQTKLYPSLTQLRGRFDDLAFVKGYYERSDATKTPFLPPSAKWH